VVLTEGGPRLLGVLIADYALDELFLTVSPVLAGRAETSRPGRSSPGQAGGTEDHRGRLF
jgi:riboflavin biosynthesis pyrimidine reductase